ncbi:hypothetical protein HDU87_008566 [Geranomyces variabilis]|uniref:Uncharacterized protein n=1 Tax=Geranomyces variabilis TaxID=109894 RepID=A0AAD5XPK0_9FUNG|nr:hypothetical protein HDU87_008566 [Geranomyces variabilis]
MASSSSATPETAQASSVGSPRSAAGLADPPDFFNQIADPAMVLDNHNVMIKANAAFKKLIMPDYAGKNFVKNLLHPDDIRTFSAYLTAFRKPAAADLSDSGAGGNREGSRDGGSGPVQDPVKCRIQTLSIVSTLPRYHSYEWAITQHPQTRHLYMVGRNLEDPCRNVSKAAEFEDFFENAPIALHWLSSEGIVLWANQTELDFLGYTREEYFGEPITNFCVDESHVVEIFKTLGSGNTIHDVPVRMRHKDGTIKHVLIDSNVNYHPDGTFNHTRCFIRDDTARKLQEAKLKLEAETAHEVLRSKEVFFSSVAHDLRTPMQALLGSVQMLLETDLDEEQEDLSTTIFTSGQELCEMLENITDAMKSSSGCVAMRISLARMNLKAEIETVIKRMGVLLHDKDVLLSLAWHGNTSGKLPEWVIGDTTNFKRILINLIGNAIKFTERGFITVSVKYDPAEPSGQTFKFFVTDTGKGIAEKDQPHVFKRYWQSVAEPGKETKEVLGVLGVGGAGLGLPICSMAVEAMNGTIGVESSQEGSQRGSKFWFTLPLEVVQDEKPKSRHRKGGAEKHGVSRAQSGPHAHAQAHAHRHNSSDASNTTLNQAPHNHAEEPMSRNSSNPQISQVPEVVLAMDKALERANGAMTQLPFVARSGPPPFSEPGPNGVAQPWGGSKYALDSQFVDNPSSPPIPGGSLTRYALEQPQAYSRVAPEENGAGRDHFSDPSFHHQQVHDQQHQQQYNYHQQYAQHSQHSHQRAQSQYQHQHQQQQASPAEHAQQPYRTQSSYTPYPIQSYFNSQPPPPAPAYSAVTQSHTTQYPPTPSTSSQTPYSAALDSASGLSNSDSSSARSSSDLSKPLRLRILAAEDNSLCQKVLSQILRRCGCEVVLTADGVQCINAWEEEPHGFDAILMDIRMPTMDGITATRMLRERGCSIPILAITAERGEAERQKCLLVGMNSFLSKPLVIKDLVARLRDLCHLNVN